MRGEQRVGIQGFLNWNAANEGRDFAGNLVEPAEHNMFARRLHPGALQHVVQSWAGKSRRAHRTLAPLNAGNLRAMQATAVAGALKSVNDRVGVHFRKLGQAQCECLLYFATDHEMPVIRIQFAGFVHVITYEEVWHRSEPGIEILDGALQIKKAKRAKNHPLFAGKIDGLRLRKRPSQKGSHASDDRGA